MMVASLGIFPAAAIVATVGSEFSSFDESALAESLFAGDDRFVNDWLGDAAVIRPMLSQAVSPVEIVLRLEGRSLAEEQELRAASGLPPLSPAQQRGFVANLRDVQAGVRATVESFGGRVLHQYQIVYNGIAVSASPAAIGRIAAMPNVARILPTATYEIALDHSVAFTFGGRTNAQLGADGTGITIAIIDSGVDYTHAALGGSGDPDDWASNNRTVTEAGTFPTAKVVGGTDLVGEFYDARGFHPVLRPACTDTPVPDADPLDDNGHGSHVAGIAAGMAFDTFPQGVAPGATLFAVKLFSGCALDGTASTSSANVVAAIEVATDPDGDGDTSDHVDIINMSLGGPFGRDTELTAVASNAAVEAGVIVVASAGNSGNIPYITGSPAAASRAISVAAGNDPGLRVQLVTVAGTASSNGEFESLEGAFTPALADTGTRSGIAVRLGAPGSAAAQACSTGATPAPPAPGSLTGMIPLIQRGVCTFQEKVMNAEAAGAIAVVVYNNVAGAGPIVMGGTVGSVAIPAVMVGTSDGVAISAAIDSDTTFTLDPNNLLPIPNRLQSFTSRGPRFGDSSIKPDITAPGGSIFSVAVASGTGGVSFSGTSMSSPHVAGVMALLRQLHPTWSIPELKSLAMNTATNAEPVPGTPYPVTLMGAGRVRIDVAVDTESVVVPGSASFGVTEKSSTSPRTFETQLQVRNKGTSTKTFSLSTGFLFPSDDEGSITFSHPSTLTVGAGRSRSFTFAMRVNFNALAPGAQFEEYDGFLTLTETTAGADVLRVPFHMVPMARADAELRDDEVELPDETTFQVRNSGIRSTSVDIYQLGGRDPNEDLILEGPGMPKDPDDWFDIRYFGAHKFPLGTDTLIEFGTVNWGRRSAPSLMQTEVYIDVDGGGPDFVVVIADDVRLGLAADFTGRIVSAIFSLSTGAGASQFVMNNDRNQEWQTGLIRLSRLNSLAGPDLTAADPDFEYFVVTFDLETGFFDETAMATFNVFAPTLDASPQFFDLAAGARTTVNVLGSSAGKLLLIHYNNSIGRQGELLDVEVEDDDGDDGDD